MGWKAALKQAKGKYVNIIRSIAVIFIIAKLEWKSILFFRKLKEENPFEFACTQLYSKGSGADINKASLDPDWEKGNNAELIHSLDRVISKYPALDAEIRVFKGTYAGYWDSAVVGKTVSPPCFISSSTDMNTAETYLKKHQKTRPFMVEIRALKNTKGLYIGSNTAYNKGVFRRNEYEYLFPRNTVFKVLEKDEFHIVLETVVEQV
jgi:hypothetical protein